MQFFLELDLYSEFVYRSAFCLLIDSIDEFFFYNQINKQTNKQTNEKMMVDD